MRFPIDLTEIETQRQRGGYRLQCPICKNWVGNLLILESGKLACDRCQKTRGNNPAPESGEKKQKL